MTANSTLTQSSQPLTPELARRVLMLETDERAGLVSAISSACHAAGVSLEITTGLSHVLLTFDADGPVTERTAEALRALPGVAGVYPYTVLAVPSGAMDD